MCKSSLVLTFQFASCRPGFAIGSLLRRHKPVGACRGMATLVCAVLLFATMVMSGCGAANTGSSSGGGSTPPPNSVPSTYTTSVPNENALQWKLSDNGSSATVAGGSLLNGFTQNGTLIGGTSTSQVAGAVDGTPAFHLNGQYVSINLSTIHSYETANLWTKYSSNPVISTGFPQDCEIVRNPSGPTGGDWYCFGSVAGQIDRYESGDLIHWSDPIQVLAAGGTGAWDEQVQDGYVFQDPLNGGLWMMLYRGYSTAGGYQIGLATSADGTNFSRKGNSGVNEGLFANFGANYDAVAVMLVGQTYYVYVNGSPTHNTINVYTSTDDFNTLTPYSHNPVFVSAFCPTVWSYGGDYYMLIARDLDASSAAPLSHGIALYRSKNPTFDPNIRQYLGYAIVNDQSYDGRYLDSPSVPMMDVYRTSYPSAFGNVLYMLYAGVDQSRTGLSFKQSIAYTSLSALSMLTPIPESVTESLSTSTPITYSFWIQFDSLVDRENVFRVGGSTPTDGTPTWFVSVEREALALYLSGTYALTSLRLHTNTPYHVAIVDSVIDKNVYIDGSLVGTFTYPISNPYPTPTYIYLGAGDGTSTLQGLIWDFRIYPQALTASEAGDLYTNGSVAPNISNISASVTSSGATITWQTDSPATTQVEYGPSPTYSASSSLNPSPTLTHSASLSGLSASTVYHFAVKSSDGTVSTSADQTFTTGASN